MIFSFLSYFWQPLFCGQPLFFAENLAVIPKKPKSQDRHHRRPHRDAAGVAQLGHGVRRLHRDAGATAALRHRLGDGGVGVAGEVDPFGPSFPDGFAGLLHADDLFLRSKFRQHGDFLLIRMAKFAEYIRAVENYSMAFINRQAFP